MYIVLLRPIGIILLWQKFEFVKHINHYKYWVYIIFLGGKNGNISHNYSGTSFIPNKLQLITSLSGYKKLMVRLGLKTMHPVCVANIVLTLAHRCAMIKKSSIAITT